jgi:hypothetical protein
VNFIIQKFTAPAQDAIRARNFYGSAPGVETRDKIFIAKKIILRVAFCAKNFIVRSFKKFLDEQSEHRRAAVGHRSRAQSV